MLKAILILIAIGLTGCGNIHAPNRFLASKFGHLDSKNINELDIDLRIESIYYLAVLAEEELNEFDENLKYVKSTNELYSSDNYFRLQAIRISLEQTIEELTEIQKSIIKNKMNHLDLSKKVEFFKENFPNGDIVDSYLKFNNKADVEIKPEIILEIKKIPNYKHYQLSIKHLANLLKQDFKESVNLKIEPSFEKKGNITGNEFPNNVWSLTFDDGPGVKTTLEILHNLKQHSLKASFFQLTSKVKSNAKIAHEIQDAKMEIASHSYTHKDLTKVTKDELEFEISSALKDLKSFYKKDIYFFRLPYGAGVNTKYIREVIATNKLIHVFWNVDTLDWVSQTPEKIVIRTKDLMKKTKNQSGIILFHDIHQRTVQASLEIMKELKKTNKRVCLLKRIVDEINEGKEKVCEVND